MQSEADGGDGRERRGSVCDAGRGRVRTQGRRDKAVSLPGGGGGRRGEVGNWVSVIGQGDEE